MAKKVKSPQASLSPDGRRRTKRLLGCAAGALLGGLMIFGWAHLRVAAQIRNELPSVPNLTAKQSLLADKFSRANALAHSYRRARDGLAELGRLYHANGYFDHAAVCWRLLEQEQPKVPQWPYLLADLHRHNSDYVAMTAALNKTVRLAPDYAPAWLKLAEAAFKYGNLPEAARCYERRLALLPGDPYARLGLARLARQNGHEAEARRLIEQLVKDSPEFSTGQNLFAEMLAAEGKTDQARMHRWLGRETGRYREADDPWLSELSAWCFDPRKLQLLATVALQTQQGDRGRALMERMAALSPDPVAAAEILGDHYLKLGEPDKARVTLEAGLQAAQGRPASIAHYHNLIRAYRQLHRPEEALRIARQGIAQVPEAPELHNALGETLEELAKPEEAMAAFRAAVANNPNDAEANFNLAAALLRVERYDEAVLCLQRSLTLQPTFPKSLKLLGRLELDSSHLGLAGQYIRPLFEAHPGDDQARQLLGEWHLLSGRESAASQEVATAEQHFRAGLALQPEEPEINAALGTLLLSLDRAPEALPLLAVSQRVQPQNPEFSFLLGQAYALQSRPAEARRWLTEAEQLARVAGRLPLAEQCKAMRDSLR